MFDPKKFTIETVTVKDCQVAYRAHEGIVYVANPVEAPYQSLNFYVPVEYYEGKSVGGYTAETALIFLPNSVGGYMPGKSGNPKSSREIARFRGASGARDACSERRGSAECAECHC
jgi:hypothetical protein